MRFLKSNRQKWFFSALGNTEGSFAANGKEFHAKRGCADSGLNACLQHLRIQSSMGSFGDSLDDILFCYTEILPDNENFEIRATFTVKEAPSSIGWQSGYGIFAIDTVNSGNIQQRYRNHLGVGRFRTQSAVRHSAGLRAVSGYLAADASEVVGSRILDLSRGAYFSAQEPRIRVGECYRLSLEKTDAGFVGMISYLGETETFHLPGCDFLMRQDPHRLYVGFAVAGAMILDVSDIRFHRSPGKSSATPAGAIQAALPDYPFPRELSFKTKAAHRLLSRQELFVSPDGNADGDGSRLNPLDLQTALCAIQAGHTILLLDGFYRPKAPYYVPKESSGEPAKNIMLRAEHFGRAILDGSGLHPAAPLFILHGSGWHLKDLVFCNSPLSGLMICGSNNIVEHCEAHHNQDTGILICTYPGTGRADWPSGNHVVCCDSHHNCDMAHENADGFGAKLSVGDGNVFYECTAHHNIDDGFDLFSKNVLGPIGSVLLENCVAYENGRLEEDEQAGKTGGMGFKLGGDHLAIAHRVKNSIAYRNRQAGFSTNNNPVARMENLTAWQNGRISLLHNYHLVTGRTDMPPDWQCSGLLPKDSVYTSVAGQTTLPVVMRENPGQPAEELERQQMRNLENLFVSIDTSVRVTRDKNDLIDMHGLLAAKDGILPGAKLDAEHLAERLHRKEQLVTALSNELP